MLLSKKFISATNFWEYATYSKIVNAPYLRKNMNLEKKPEKAEITICGLGFYKLFVNGKDITKGLIAPYISNSDKVVFFDNYDITPYLTAGKNTFGFMLGNGMQNCVGGSVWDLGDGVNRSAPKLAFAIEIDGVLTEADTSVVTHPSPILFDDIRCGVHYDANLEIPGWNLPDFDDSAWSNAIPAETPRGQFTLCGAQPIVIKEELKPVAIEENIYLDRYDKRNDVEPNTIPFYDSSEDDKAPGYLYDFGQNNAGIIKLKIKGTKGQRVVIQFVEHKSFLNGKPYTTNLHFYPDGYAMRDIYICRGGEEEIFIPDFTYHGFRYCWVLGITKEQATPDLLTFLTASSSLDLRADFKCSDETTNKLWEASLRSDYSNFYYFPTDCPHREKNGWTGDASVSAEHMVLKLDVEPSYKDWLLNIRSHQNCAGALPGIVPTAGPDDGWGFAWGNGPIWDSVLFNLPYYVYLLRGKTELISENATNMMRYLDYISKKRDDRGLIAIGLGDWCPVGKVAHDYDCPLEFTDTVATMDSARKAAVMFRAIGLTNQAEFAENLYFETREAIRAHLIDFNTMTVLGACQSGQAIALALGVFDPAEKSEAYTRLLEFIEMREDHMDTGFYGARYIFYVLSDFGDADLAYRMITRPDYPSYGNWIARGATTLWENFFPETQEGSSLNHHFWGHISAWYLKVILGININPTEDNAKRVEITPKFIEALDNAEGYVETACGKLSVKWARNGSDVDVSIECPAGLTGNIQLPFGYKCRDKSVVALKTCSFKAERII